MPRDKPSAASERVEDHRVDLCGGTAEVQRFVADVANGNVGKGRPILYLVSSPAAVSWPAEAGSRPWDGAADCWPSLH